MTILLAEDEVGIREGLAAYLGLKGHEVHAVGTVAEALERLARLDYEAVVTDWQLDGEIADSILDMAGSRPCIVISGSPEDVHQHPSVARILAKPVRPGVLVEELADLLAPTKAEPDPGAEDRERAGPDCGRPWEDFALEVRELLETAAALITPGAEWQVENRAGVVCIEIRALPTRLLAPLASLGGDLQADPVTGDVRWRIYADGRPSGVEVVVPIPRADSAAPCWPDRPFALDCSQWRGGAEELAAVIATANGHGCLACLHLSGPLRRALRVLEAPLPVRVPPGPEIGGPEALLWSIA